MRYHDSVFGKLIKPISRRQFEAIVQRHAGNAYDKSVKRSTLSDADARRLTAIFAEAFEQLSALAESSLKRRQRGVADH